MTYRGVMVAAVALAVSAPAAAKTVVLDFEPGTFTTLADDGEGYKQYLTQGILIEMFGEISGGVLNVAGGMAFRIPTATLTSVDVRGPATVQVRANGSLPVATINAGNAFATYGPYANVENLIFTTAPSENFSLDNAVFEFADAPGVPEPTTWAMLVAGFGLIGGAVRRRSISVDRVPNG